MTTSLSVVRATGLVTVQDGGRPGYKGLAIPAGGPLAPSRFERANLVVGNRKGAAAIEVVGALTVSSPEGGVEVGADGETARVLAAGESLQIASDATRRVRYLAVRGGIDVPIAFGGRGTLLVAGLGGLEGRVLKKGDRLDVGVDWSTTRKDPGAWVEQRATDPDPVTVVLGPDESSFDTAAVDTLLSAEFTVSRDGDRVGIRLDGPPIVAKSDPARRSAPMVRGAIEITGDGRAIVLGPDHPTTGGYPVIAVVISADVERVVAASIGQRLRFICRSASGQMDRAPSIRR